MLSVSIAVSSLFLLCWCWPQGALFLICTLFTPFSDPQSWLLDIMAWKQSPKPWAWARSAGVCPLLFLKLDKRRARSDETLRGGVDQVFISYSQRKRNTTLKADWNPPRVGTAWGFCLIQGDFCNACSCVLFKNTFSKKFPFQNYMVWTYFTWQESWANIFAIVKANH